SGTSPRAMPGNAVSDEDFVERLRPSFAALPSTIKSIDRALLKDVVCTYVDDAKRLGWSPERVVFVLKTAAYSAGLPWRARWRFPRALSHRDPRVIIMVRWCVKHYFDREVPDTSPL